jgi:N-acetylneuraminic acid mutarotase
MAAEWSSLPSLSAARYGAGAASLGSDFYVLGGSGTTDLADVSVWRESAGAWSAVSPMSTTRQFPGAVAVAGQLYAIGGYGPGGNPIASVERFNPGANAWSAVAPLPAVRALAGVAVVNGQIFVLSGEGTSGMPQESCYRYDPAANTWTMIAPITPRSGAAAAVLDGEIHLIGGAFGSSLANTDIYTPANGAWRVGPALPEALWMPTAATFEGRIWVMGGFDAGFQRSNRVYSLGTGGVWVQETNLPLALAGAAAASDGMRLVVAGGLDASGQPVESALTRMSDSPPPPPPPPPAADDTLFCSVEITPRTLNLKSNGHWVSADIRCEEGSVASIDVASLTLEGVGVDMAAPWSLDEGVLRVKFPRDGFRFLADGDVILALGGLTHEGDVVSGQAALRVSGGGGKQPQSRPMPAMKPGRGNGPMAAVEFSLAAPAMVTMDVLDVQGRHLGEIASGTFQAGSHTVEWNGARQAPAGIYFVRARIGEDTQIMRFAVIR